MWRFLEVSAEGFQTTARTHASSSNGSEVVCSRIGEELCVMPGGQQVSEWAGDDSEAGTTPSLVEG